MRGTRDGSKASNLLKAARRFGMEGRGIRCELDALLRTKPPVILYWNFNHFLVYEGVSEGKVYLNDPATGPRRVTIEELEASFTGVVLTVEPGPSFAPGGEKPSLSAALRRRISGFEIGLGFALLTGLLIIIPNIVNPSFTRIFIDEYLIGDKADILRPLLTTIVISIVLMVVLLGLQRHSLLRLETKLALTTSAKFFTHVIQLPMEFFSQRYAGEIGSRVLINDKVAKVLSDKFVTTALDMMALVFFAIVMIQYDLWLTISCVAFAMLNLVAMKVVQRSRVNASFRLLQERGKLMGTSMNGVQMIETLKATGGENEFFSRWGGYQAKTIRAEQDMDFYGQTLSAVPPFTKALISATILGLARWLAGHGRPSYDRSVGCFSVFDGRLYQANHFICDIRQRAPGNGIRFESSGRRAALSLRSDLRQRSAGESRAQYHD